jgi:hypothetical protein
MSTGKCRLYNSSRSSWGAVKLFANVATICTDAFWFSAVALMLSKEPGLSRR